MLREWLISITLCSLACSLVYILVPRGAMEKMMKTIISLFVIGVIAAPLAGVLRGADNYSFSNEGYTYEEYARQVNSLLVSSAENAVRQAVTDCMPALADSEIEVTASYENENTLRVESISIKLNNDSLNPETVKNELSEKLQLTAEVIP